MASEEAKEYNLKPCPFCGSSDLRVHIGVHEQTVHCHGCFVLGILSEWNRRASEPRWIPVSERLPEDGVAVVVCFDNGHMVSGSLINGDYWHLDDDQLCNYVHRSGVKHWFALPESPKP